MSTGTLPRPLTRSRAAIFLALIGIGVGQAAAAAGLALLTKRGFDSLLGSGARMDVGLLIGGLVLCVFTSGLVRGSERSVSERLGQSYVRDVRACLFDHLTSVPARTLSDRGQGETLMKFVGDLSSLRLWVARGLARLTVAGVAICLALVALATMNVAVAAAVGLVLGAGGLLTLLITPWLLRTAKRSRRRRSNLTGEVAERVAQVAVVQASGQERRERRRVGRHSDKVAEAMVEQARASGAARAIAEGAGVAALATALVVGGLEARAGRASPGTVVAAVSVAGLLSTYLRDLGRVAEYAARARIARAAARKFLTLPVLPVPPDAPDIQITEGAVDLDNVTVGTALRGVSARAWPGERVAIVGHNGAGKSTLLSVIARMIDPDEGTVTIDGQDVRGYALASLRGAVGISAPGLPLLAGTMRRNVTYRKASVEDEELDRIARLCELEQLADALPEGWSTDVGPGGCHLSAGQQARISIARAALARPALLMLDEAEAHLDADKARVVEQVLADHHGTALVVTHRAELIARLDRVWLLADGALIGNMTPAEYLRGTHEARHADPRAGVAQR